eukprot:365339-Chlamydomonas_euryale.AAC.5
MAGEKGGGKGHRKAKVGRKADKRKDAEAKKAGTLEQSRAAKAGANPRAFAFQSAGKAKAARARTAEKEQRRLHAPMLAKDAEEPPPLLVLVQGPPGVGKSTLIRCLVKHFTNHNLADVLGPVTVVAGKQRRVTLVECPGDLNGMIDAAKYADLVLLLIDGSFGFEMETFEFLNLLQVVWFGNACKRQGQGDSTSGRVCWANWGKEGRHRGKFVSGSTCEQVRSELQGGSARTSRCSRADAMSSGIPAEVAAWRWVPGRRTRSEPAYETQRCTTARCMAQVKLQAPHGSLLLGSTTARSKRPMRRRQQPPLNRPPPHTRKLKRWRPITTCANL